MSLNLAATDHDDDQPASVNEEALLERFVVDNSELDQLEDRLAVFNIFEVLKLQHQEIRHSNFLAWLLDPSGTHSLGTYVLKRFLSQTTSTARSLGIETVTPVDIDVWDLSDTVVLREDNRLDILLLNEPNMFLCVIENKLFSGEHSDQLTRYRHLVEQNYPNFRRHYVLLSPESSPPEDDREQLHWAPVSYHTVCQLVEHTAQTKQSTLSDEVRTLIHHYTAMLRRYVLEDSEMQQLARRIYQRHRAAIELILEHRPDAMSEIRQVIEHEVQKVHNLKLDHSSKSYIRFFPDDWDRFPELLQGQGWTPSGRMLLFQFNNSSDSVTLVLVLGPGPADVRKAVFDLATQRENVFGRRRRNLTPRWTTLFRKDFLKKGDYDDPDIEAKVSKLRSTMESFLQHDLPQIKDTIVEQFSK